MPRAALAGARPAARLKFFGADNALPRRLKLGRQSSGRVGNRKNVVQKTSETAHRPALVFMGKRKSFVRGQLWHGRRCGYSGDA